MTYKEYLAWCNDRACDGCWSLQVAVVCCDIAKRILRVPWWRRKKEWLKIKDEIDIEKVVDCINEKIESWKEGGKR